MAAATDRNGLDVLDRHACLQLLASNAVGRVGVSIGALPAVLPVNYRLVGDEVVFRTSPGAKLAAAAAGAVVAFEIDGIDPLDHAGWSVMVIGIARLVTECAEQERLAQAGVPRWAAGRDEAFVAIDTAQVSGRSLGPTRAHQA